jgi:V/A-type H+-transporting ATPase subunit A
MMKLLQEESKLLDIVQLVGEDVLPDSQRLTLEISRILKIGYLQQNAFHKEDTYVPINKQYEMLRLIDHLNNKARECVKAGIPISKVKDSGIFDSMTRMKYNIPNDDLSGIKELETRIDDFYGTLMTKYTG